MNPKTHIDNYQYNHNRRRATRVQTLQNKRGLQVIITLTILS